MIFVLNFVIRSLKAQIPFFTTPTGVMVSEGIYFLMLLAGLGFGVVALLGISRYGRKNILGRAVFGMIASGLLLFIMVTNFVSARSKAQTQTAKIAQAQQAVQNLSRDGFLDDWSKLRHEIAVQPTGSRQSRNCVSVDNQISLAQPA